MVVGKNGFGIEHFGDEEMLCYRKYATNPAASLYKYFFMCKCPCDTVPYYWQPSNEEKIEKCFYCGNTNTRVIDGTDVGDGIAMDHIDPKKLEDVEKSILSTQLSLFE